MNQNEIITTIVALMVCGLLAGVTAIPLIAGISQETTTEEYNDESNAGWLRMAYDNKPFDVEITADGGNISAGGQTGLNDDMILYADASACVMCVNGAFKIVNGYAATPEVINASTVAITNADGSLTVEADGDTVITATSPAWAYYPDATGKYAYFGADVDGVKIKADDNHAFAGTFAGAYCYNDIATIENIPYTFSMDIVEDITDNVINSVKWVSGNEYPDPTEVINVLDSTQWEYTLSSNVASIGKYIGNQTDLLVVPDHVLENDVYYPVGKLKGYGGFIGNDALVDTNGTNIVFPHTLTAFVQGAVNARTYLDGTLVIPHEVTSLSPQAFYATSFDSLIVLGSPSIDSSAFTSTPIKEVLNLGSAEITTTTAGLNADEVRSDVPASGYIAPLSTTVVVTKEGAVYDLVALLPLIMVLGIVMMGVYAVGTRYA